MAELTFPARRTASAALVLAVLLLGALPAHAQPEPAPAPTAGAPGAQAGRAIAIGGTPTEQLFDAIALGNMEIVRDAIGRGANLNARNVLGQRPVDLAIDVGRSDIAFLLLSMMRAGAPPPAALGGAASAPPPGPRAPAPRAQARAPVPAAPAIPRTPVRWANDGGAPQPELGFLGFDASRPEGARPPAGTRQAAPAPRRPVRSQPLGG